MGRILIVGGEIVYEDAHTWVIPQNGGVLSPLTRERTQEIAANREGIYGVVTAPVTRGPWPMI